MNTRFDIVLPFTVDKEGTLLISLKDMNKFIVHTSAKLYQDTECTKSVGDEIILEKHISEVNSVIGPLPKKATYYIKFTVENSDPIDIISNRS